MADPTNSDDGASNADANSGPSPEQVQAPGTADAEPAAPADAGKPKAKPSKDSAQQQPADASAAESDPADRPHYTLREFRSVTQQRDEIKAERNKLRDELAAMRTQAKQRDVLDKILGDVPVASRDLARAAIIGLGTEGAFSFDADDAPAVATKLLRERFANLFVTAGFNVPRQTDARPELPQWNQRNGQRII